MTGARIVSARDRVLADFHVSRETAARLDIYVAELLRWNRTKNLIGPSTTEDIWTRHIADSLQLLPLAPEARVWVDLGSGAGLPGVVVAAAQAERAGAVVHCIESRQAKAAFIRNAARLCRAPVIVHASRIEDVVNDFPGRVDVVTARALAPLSELIDLATPLLIKGALGLFLKGQDVGSELTEAARCWSMNFETTPSQTDPRGAIVALRSVRRAPPSEIKREPKP